MDSVGVNTAWWRQLLGNTDGALAWYPYDNVTGFRLDANCAFECPHRHFSHLLQIFVREVQPFDTLLAHFRPITSYTTHLCLTLTLLFVSVGECVDQFCYDLLPGLGDGIVQQQRCWSSRHAHYTHRTAVFSYVYILCNAMCNAVCTVICNNICTIVYSIGSAKY